MVVSPPRAPDWATNRKGTCRSTSATFSAWLSSMTCRVTTTTDADVADTGVACPVTVMTVGSAPGTDWAHGSAGPSIAIARILHVSSPWKKSWQAECLPHLGHKLLIQGGAGAFACEPIGIGLPPRAVGGGLNSTPLRRRKLRFST